MRVKEVLAGWAKRHSQPGKGGLLAGAHWAVPSSGSRSGGTQLPYLEGAGNLGGTHTVVSNDPLSNVSDLWHIVGRWVVEGERMCNTPLLKASIAIGKENPYKGASNLLHS